MTSQTLKSRVEFKKNDPEGFDDFILDTVGNYFEEGYKLSHVRNILGAVKT